MEILKMASMLSLGAAAVVFLCANVGNCASSDAKGPVKTSDFFTRDPYIVPVPEEGRYYIYGTGITDGHRTFATYFSKDLNEWFGPVVVFRADEKFWADRDFWAPEVHHYKGKYYMFASFKAEGHRRATQILVGDRTRGPFKPLTDSPITPADWDCLDGTLFIDDAGDPWIVFCHEFTQTTDGEMCAMKLSADLKTAVDKPVLLFKASSAPWVKPWPWDKIYVGDGPGYVTDGPCLYRAKNGHLLMLWSSFGAAMYTQGMARSESGKITGTWKQDPEPFYKDDGGHGMLFKRFDGQLMYTLHQPNGGGRERTHFYPVEDINGKLVFKK